MHPHWSLESILKLLLWDVPWHILLVLSSIWLLLSHDSSDSLWVVNDEVVDVVVVYDIRLGSLNDGTALLLHVNVGDSIILTRCVLNNTRPRLHVTAVGHGSSLGGAAVWFVIYKVVVPLDDSAAAALVLLVLFVVLGKSACDVLLDSTVAVFGACRANPVLLGKLSSRVLVVRASSLLLSRLADGPVLRLKADI